jgi:hypothetical protein
MEESISEGQSDPVVDGLCSTCNNKDNCIYRRARGGSAIFCELFDDSVRLISIKSAKDGMGKNQNSAGFRSSATKRYAGLCEHCADRENCPTAGDNGGVWHCEKYQ